LGQNAIAKLSAGSRRETVLESQRLACRKYDRLEGHSARTGAEFLAQRLRHGINDTIRIDATSCPDLIDDRIAVDQSSCEERNVRDLLVMSVKPASIKDSLIGSIW
jgi:hypothetical protein